MKSVIFLPLMIFFIVLPKYNQQTFWRRIKPTLPSNPNAPIYKQLQNIPSPQKTAQKILNNFVRYQPWAVTTKVTASVGKRTPTIKIEEDTVIVMDGSGSIGSCEFGEGKKAMSGLMKLCEHARSLYDCRYAAITFASLVTKNFDFQSITQASKKIKTIAYPGGSTQTHEGLDEAGKVILAGSRPRARRMVFLLTDGQSNYKQKTLNSAKNLKRISGVKVFVVAVGKYIYGIDEMAKVASYPPDKYVYRVEKLSDLKYVFELALQMMKTPAGVLPTWIKPPKSLCN